MLEEIEALLANQNRAPIFAPDVEAIARALAKRIDVIEKMLAGAAPAPSAPSLPPVTDEKA